MFFRMKSRYNAYATVLLLVGPAACAGSQSAAVPPDLPTGTPILEKMVPSLVIAAPRLSTRGSGSPLLRSASRAGWLSPEAKGKQLAFVSNYYNQNVTIYDAAARDNPPPLGQITSGISSPQAIAVDGVGTLYVTDSGKNTVTEYPKGSIVPSVTLTGLDNPASIAVADQPGSRVRVAVGNINNNTGQGGTVELFESPSTVSFATLRCAAYPAALTYDQAGDLFIANITQWPQGPSRILMVKRGSRKCHDVGISNLLYAAGLAFDKAENLWVVDDYGVTGPEIYMFPKGSTNPSSFVLRNFLQPVSVAFNTRNQNLWVSDFSAGVVYVYPYMSDKLLTTFSNSVSNPIGVAVAP